MTFVSYAQNFEDVMLWRALKHVERGFYVDVGAYSPDADSVTRAFYERGWSGINIEPNPARLAELTARRPRDLNLGVAASDSDGTVSLHVIEDTGLTTLEAEIAQEHGSAGWAAQAIDVPALTLSGLFDAHVPQDQPVHFLKIDAEGHETAVVRGLDLSRHRPWIMVVEATYPGTQRPVHEDWEPLILSARYRFAYWDGLNRYYVAEEHADLRPAFNSPPNVFDGFRVAGFAEAVAQRDQMSVLVEAAQIEATAAATKAHNLTQQLTETAAQVARAEQQLHDLKQQLTETAAQAIHTEQLCEYLMTRSLWERLLFRPNGKPKKALRRILFHKNGKPRGVFKSLILHPDGRPHKPFRMWMTGAEYRGIHEIGTCHGIETQE